MGSREPMNRLRFQPGWAIFLAIVLLGAAVNARLYFATPLHELSDFAVNALQIDQAKHLREIHGNYSRFNFDHPGPAFFYVYALGEGLFYDTLHLTASPAAAHLLAGLMLQAAFFALALALAARWVRAPGFLPLALLAAAVHFSLATHAFTSIWPPHVLALPFLAFLIAAASVAAGRGEDLPWLVLSGSFLVHGHASEPLFVVALALGAYGCLKRGQGRAEPPLPPPWRAFPRAHRLAAALLGLFLLPLLLDLRHGRTSNFAAILRHLQFNEARKSLSDSLLYLLSFFGYLHDQEGRFDPATLAHASFLREHWILYASWTAALAAAVAVLTGHLGTIDEVTRRFGRYLLGFTGLTMALCLEWGILQTGPMFEFNGYFYYSVIYALGLLLCSLLAGALPGAFAGRRGILLCAAAAVIAGFGLRVDPEETSRQGVALRRAVLLARSADPDPAAPKLLVFAHDDWSTAAATGLALERAGTAFYVTASWDFMFQRAHEVPRSLLLDPAAHLSVWRFLHRPEGDPAVRLTDEISVVFQPATLSPEGGLIDFSGRGHLEWYALAGIVTPDSESTWTDSPDVAVQFRPLPTTHDVVLRLTASPFLCGKKLPDQVVEMRFNGVLVTTADLTRPGEMRAVIPRALWNQRPVALFALHLPHARTPASLGLSGDPRRLGLSLTRLTASH